MKKLFRMKLIMFKIESRLETFRIITNYILLLQGILLNHNVTARIVRSNQSLVLQRVAKNSGGRYSCSATNPEGETISDELNLRVKCEWNSLVPPTTPSATAAPFIRPRLHNLWRAVVKLSAALRTLYYAPHCTLLRVTSGSTWSRRRDNRTSCIFNGTHSTRRLRLSFSNVA